MKWFENIFTKSKLMIICGILSVAGYFALACISVINSAHLTEQYLIFAVLSGLLLICYKKKHLAKNPYRFDFESFDVRLLGHYSGIYHFSLKINVSIFGK